MANEDAREGVASVFDAEDMRTLFHEGLAAEGDAPHAGMAARQPRGHGRRAVQAACKRATGQNDFDQIFKGPRVEFEFSVPVWLAGMYKTFINTILNWLF